MIKSPSRKANFFQQPQKSPSKRVAIDIRYMTPTRHRINSHHIPQSPSSSRLKLAIREAHQRHRTNMMRLSRDTSDASKRVRMTPSYVNDRTSGLLRKYHSAFKYVNKTPNSSNEKTDFLGRALLRRAQINIKRRKIRKFDFGLSKNSPNDQPDLGAIQDLFCHYVDLQNNLQSVKKELAGNEEITLKEIFNSIFEKKSVRGNLAHFMDFLRENLKEFEISDEEMQTLFARMDKDKDDIVSWEDFRAYVSPEEKPSEDSFDLIFNKYQKIQNFFLNINSNQKKSTFDWVERIVRIVKLEIDGDRKEKKLKKKILERETKLRDLFNTVAKQGMEDNGDGNGQLHIDRHSIKFFMKEIKSEFEDEDAQLILDRLRIDSKMEISYDDFENLMKNTKKKNPKIGNSFPSQTTNPSSISFLHSKYRETPKLNLQIEKIENFTDSQNLVFNGPIEEFSSQSGKDNSFRFSPRDVISKNVSFGQEDILPHSIKKSINLNQLKNFDEYYNDSFQNMKKQVEDTILVEESDPDFKNSNVILADESPGQSIILNRMVVNRSESPLKNVQILKKMLGDFTTPKQGWTPQDPFSQPSDGNDGDGDQLVESEFSFGSRVSDNGDNGFMIGFESQVEEKISSNLYMDRVNVTSGNPYVN